MRKRNGKRFQRISILGKGNFIFLAKMLKNKKINIYDHTLLKKYKYNFKEIMC